MRRLSRPHAPCLFAARCLAVLTVVALFAGCANNPPFDDAGSSSGANSSGATGTGAKAQSGGTTIAIKNFLYQPSTLTVPAGTTVTWTQFDVIPHTVTSGRPGGEDAGTIFDNTLSSVNQTYSFTFDTPGTFAYFCRFHPEMVAGVVVTGAGSGGPAATQTTSPRIAATPTPPPPVGAKLVADKLINPRGFTWGPDGSLYVAEAGTKPSDTASSATPSPGPVKPGCESWRPSFDRSQAHCPGAGGPTIGSNGRIEKFAADGTRTVVADKLPVVDGPFAATMGVTSVAFVGQDLYTVIAAGETRGAPKFPTGVYKVNGDGSVTLWANLEAFQKANPPQYIPPDYNFSNPYDMVSMNGKLYISDGNACVIFEVDPAVAQNKRIRRLADLSVGHPVTTGIAAGADGNVYVTIMTIPPYPPGAAKVFKIGASGVVTEIGSGLSLGTGLAIGPDGTFYVAEFANALGKAPYVVPPGRIMKLQAGGTPQQVAAPLMYPAMMRWGPDGLYSDAFSIGTSEGATPLGAIYRIDTGGK